MKKTFIIIDSSRKKRLFQFLEDQPQEPVLEVIVKEHKRNLSVEQRSYYWVLMSIVKDHTGMSTDEAHTEFKRRHLIRIFERDDADFAAMVGSVNEIHKKGMIGHAHRMKSFIVEKTSIMDANTSQMAEYIDAVIMDCRDRLALQLPPPQYRGR